MNQSITINTTTGISTRVKTAAISLLIGFALIFVVGFSSPMPMHNAAHDTRHAAAFPCH